MPKNQRFPSMCFAFCKVELINSEYLAHFFAGMEGNSRPVWIYCLLPALCFTLLRSPKSLIGEF